MSIRLLTFIFIPLMMSSCSIWDPSGSKAQHDKLLQKEADKKLYDMQLKEKQADAEKSQALNKQNFENSHPEVLVSKEEYSTGSSAGDELRNALFSFDFVTRYPDQQTSDNVYVNVGRTKLTARMVSNSISAYMDDCKRVSAYNDSDYKQACMRVLAKGIKDFTSVLKENKIPGLTKQAALSEASYGRLIDFEHAARLAKMHTSLCEQQGNKGYVSMITIAAPCSDFRGVGVSN